LTRKTFGICALSLMTAAVAATTALASSVVVGMTSSQSGVFIDDAAVGGNATLFDGSRVQTTGFSRLQMSNGASLGLGAGSKVQVFTNRVSLESGAAEVQSSSSFAIEARSLKIVAADSGSIARVKLDGDSRVMVTAVNAPVNVLNRDGILVARVTPSLPLSFLPQAGASSAFDMTGCVVNKAGAAILVGSTGMYELRGANLKAAIGNSVHVKGTVSSAAPAGGASQVITVTSSEITAKGGCTSALAKAGTGATLTAAGLGAAASTGTATAAAAGATAAAAGAGAATGVSTAVIVGGVAAATAGTIGGLAAAGTFSSTSP
jgi:hypothetical protein